MLALLSIVSSQTGKEQCERHREKDRRPHSCPDEPWSSGHVKVRVIERPGPARATISWCDPKACYYGDQTWRASVARQPGVCALSGVNIQRGDSIYRPGPSKPPPLNANAMILAHFIESSQAESLYSTSNN
ncbi:hypothetical protein BZM27_45745 [Paraburkholderia steynii]|uniref:DUF3331 domain-containing protein n=1 Tax=Paraburkholderia steynii TaxID=1245441 RepID=A0A4R0X176_9BURK|nr:hypothetical protein BZM27_45745 [Paraburkholderia steynii]